MNIHGYQFDLEKESDRKLYAALTFREPPFFPTIEHSEESLRERQAATGRNLALIKVATSSLQ